jgi:hypothetical protein
MAQRAVRAKTLVKKWKSKLLSEEKRGKESIDGEVIVGPRDLVGREILVERHLKSSYPNLRELARPTTVFLWEIGEGSGWRRGRGTRIGGTPWWPADDPWPVDSVGEPLRFVAQLDFDVKHSLEIELPGDILSLFITEEEGFWGDFHFFWHTAEEGKKLLKPQEMPSFSDIEDFEFGPFFGHPYLTYDYELYDWRSQEAWLQQTVEDIEEPDWSERIMPGVSDARWVPVLQATKIGGIPYFIQSFMPGSSHCNWKPDWTFLCTISSIWDQRFSRGSVKGLFVNQPRTLPEYTKFMLGDVGQIYIFLDELGGVRYWWDCY